MTARTVTKPVSTYDLPRALIFSDRIRQFTSYTLRWLHELEKAKKFPPRIHLGASRIAWDAEAVAQWQRGEWKPAEDPAEQKSE